MGCSSASSTTRGDGIPIHEARATNRLTAAKIAEIGRRPSDFLADATAAAKLGADHEQKPAARLVR